MPGAVKSGIFPTNASSSVTVKLGHGGSWENAGTATTINVGDKTANSDGGTQNSLSGMSTLLPLAGTDGANKRQGRRGGAAITVFTMKLTKSS